MTQLTPRHYQEEGIDYLCTPNVDPTYKMDPASIRARQDARREHEQQMQLSKKVQADLGPLFASLWEQPSTTYTEQQLIATCCRHILADAPGAGKTFQATEAALRLTPSDSSILIICPAHLAQQWFDFIAEQYPTHSIVQLETGPKAKRLQELTQRAKWFIVPVQTLRRQDYVDALTQTIIQNKIDCAIIDESHYIKSHEAKQTHAVRTLTRPDFVPHVILLTATPIIKEADDLYSQLKVCDPEQFRRFDSFLNEYCYYISGSYGPMNVSLRKSAKEQLQPYLWGRTYADIGLELPPLISTTHSIPLAPAHRKMYDEIKQFWWTQTHVPDENGEVLSLNANSAMECMHMLRHVTSSDEKQLLITEYISDDPGPYLIATWYRASAKACAAAINKAHPHLQTHIISGEVPADVRPQKARAATRPTDVIIATIPSISEGVDLSHCNTVYTYEEDYTPGRMYQFLSRVRRHRNARPHADEIEIAAPTVPGAFPVLHIDTAPTNETPVILRHMHAKRTIDERIHAVQTQRAVNIRDIIKVELDS
jgi:superfamily II DNA or RNA helicase